MKKKIFLLNIIVILCFSSVFTSCGKKEEKIQITEGELFTLEQAYAHGYLSHNDLLNIAYYHQDTFLNEETTDSDFSPIDMEPKELSEDIDRSVKQTLVNILNEKSNVDSFQAEKIAICAYYGTYNDGVVVRMVYSNGDTTALTAVTHEDSVDGIRFYYTDYTVFFRTHDFSFSNSIMYWKMK